MKTIVFSHALHDASMVLLERDPDIEVLIGDKSEPGEYLDALKRADAFILRVGRMTGALIRECPELKVISRPGVGVDVVDVQTATEFGIPVVIAPGANTRSVAEHAMALFYTIAKNVVESHNETKSGNFFIRNRGVARELKGLKAGVIGFGNIGRETAKIFRNNELEILVYDPFVKEEIVNAMGYAMVPDLLAILGMSDVITLHMPSIPETRGMFGKKEFDAMKDGIFVINCARGDILVEEALCDALHSGKVAGAAVDVMCAEPMDAANPLFELPNFIATPHMASLTVEAFASVSMMTVQGTLAVLRGERWPYVFNQDAYEHPRWK